MVNLPSYVKAYPGRVVEAMAVARPVVSPEVPNRPLTKALFEDGKEIVLYGDDPAELATNIRRLPVEPRLAHRIAENARRKLLRFHTVENRVKQILTWIENGEAPTFY